MNKNSKFFLNFILKLEKISFKTIFNIFLIRLTKDLWGKKKKNN
jgi:hypothetical protein